MKLSKLINRFGGLAIIALATNTAEVVWATDPYANDYVVNHGPAPREAAFDYRPGEIIVKFKANVSQPTKLKAVRGKVQASASAQQLNSLLEKYGAGAAEELMPLTGATVTPVQKRARALNGSVVNDTDLSALYVVRLDPAKASDMISVAKEFAELGDVEYAEPNYIVHACVADAATYTADPLYSQQWGPAAIGLDKLWNAPVVSDKRPIIAILDTGVDIEHPDLADNIWTNQLEVNGSDGRDDDANGFVDDIHGWDFVNNSARMRDNNGHGTHCAGIAAAVGGNGIGITGANPDALIMPVTTMQSNGSGDMATIIKGVDYAAANGADIISMSFGSYAESMALNDALGKAYQKAVLVAAAGNDALNINPPFGNPMYPAALSFVLGVEASSSASGSLASFSNYDPDGPITSRYADLLNYELRAPGTNIMSTYPGGQYKALNGTSMACPLVAGAISRLISCREIASKEELFGDLISTAKGNIDIFNAYSLTDADRKPTLSLVTYRIDDAEDGGDGDGRVDAGETIRIYPTLKNLWGRAEDVTYKIRLADFEDPEIATFPNGNTSITFPSMSDYATAVAVTPAIVKISPTCVDGRIIQFVVEATCRNITSPMSTTIDVTVENGIELNGVLKEDMTLTPDKYYIVTSNFVVPEGRTLTIEPGTTLCFKDDVMMDVTGTIVACGEPNKMIKFRPADGALGNIKSISFAKNILKYCIFEDFSINDDQFIRGLFENCIFNYLICRNPLYNFGGFYFNFCNLNNLRAYGLTGEKSIQYTNIIRNEQILSEEFPVLYEKWTDNNLFSTIMPKLNDRVGSISLKGTAGTVFGSYGNYLGSANPDVLRNYITDIHTPGSNNLCEFDYNQITARPVHEAHGIVWKVVVNGYDAQDEYDMLPPLGVGTHKFEVYFNRKMNQNKAPMVAMGIRAPYTQVSIGENGSWRTETIDGDEIDVYTTYLTIRGKDSFDGVNTIYVADAEDDEFFPIPIEDIRFKVNVQSAGAMSSGFVAEPGVGKVKLTWENPEENFDDMLGYNMYRYILDENNVAGDTIRINEKLLDNEELIDYDIVPGTTYCYYYKVLRTSLTENSPSKVVAATPRAAGKGDADASGDVDVADVVTEVNYMVGREPKPFMFEAADINDDTEIDILDVVGTVNIIMQPKTEANSLALATAVYTIEDGLLYVDCTTDIAGVQVDLNGTTDNTEIRALDALRGMECTGDRIGNDEYRFVAFSLSGKTIESGRQAILAIGDAGVDNIILVDSNGKRIAALRGDTNGISAVVGQQMKVPYPNPFDTELNVPVTIATDGTHNVEISLTNLVGSTVVAERRTLGYGEHNITLKTDKLAGGFYIVNLTVDGKNIQSAKAVKK